MAVIPAELMKEYVRKGISELGYQPRFNELSQQMQNGEEQWKDADYSKLHIELRNIAPASYIDDMVRVVAEENKFHPALDWIAQMRAAGWDGNDWIHQLATYFDNPDGMFETYLKKWMIGVVDMKGNCKDCKYYCEGKCTVPMWKDAALYTEHETQPAATCELFEEASNAAHRN